MFGIYLVYFDGKSCLTTPLKSDRFPADLEQAVSKFLVIEGLIGVGKTSLCRIMKEAWDAHLVLEPWADNPFLASFYSDQERYAFPAQMFYLANRFSQQQGLRQTELFSNLIVADYIFQKDRLFAEQTLEGNELQLYKRFADLLGETLVKPDLVVFLDAPTDVIMRRIDNRGISAEQSITPEYLDSLRERYFTLWKGYSDAPVRYLDTSTINYIDNPEDRQGILGLIQGWLNGDNDVKTPASFVEREEQLTLFERGVLEEA